MGRAIAAVTIGQRPRPDLLAPLLARLPADVEVVEEGALDGLTAAQLAPRAALDASASDDAYPLTTRLRDGTAVTMDEAALAPLVQAAVARAGRAGADVTLLLCAGGFLDVVADGPLVRPFDAAVERLRSLGARRIAVVVPFEAQATPVTRKWEDAGFEPLVIVGQLPTLEPPGDGVDAIVLDYVGHPADDVTALRARTQLPVVDLGECGAEAVERYLLDDGAARPPRAR
jgi:protein AroM